MKRYLLLFFSLFVIFNFSVVSFAVVERGRADYESGYDAGYDRGFDNGETQGFETGHTAGYANAVQTEYTNWIDESMSRFTNKFTGLLQPISDAWNSLTTTISKFFQSIENKFKEMMDYIKKIFVPTFNFSIVKDASGNYSASIIESNPRIARGPSGSVVGSGSSVTSAFKTVFEDKFSFIEVIKTELSKFDSILHNLTPAPPKFEIDIYGVKCPLVNFEPFMPFRQQIHNIILIFAYIEFFINLFRHIPQVVDGVFVPGAISSEYSQGINRKFRNKT